MSLNNIQLSPELLAGLYRDVLIETKNDAGPASQVRFLGNNNKNILILVRYESSAFPQNEERSFLTNILAACKLSLDDVAIVNIHTLPQPVSYQSLNEEFGSKAVLLFDVASTSIDLPFHFPHYQVQQFDHCTYLSAPALSEIREDKTAKQLLWACLKNLFQLG